MENAASISGLENARNEGSFAVFPRRSALKKIPVVFLFLQPGDIFDPATGTVEGRGR